MRRSYNISDQHITSLAELNCAELHQMLDKQGYAKLPPLPNADSCMFACSHYYVRHIPVSTFRNSECGTTAVVNEHTRWASSDLTYIVNLVIYKYELKKVYYEK